MKLNGQLDEVPEISVSIRVLALRWPLSQVLG